MRKITLILFSLFAIGCSDANGIRIYDSPASSYVSSSMDVIKTRQDQKGFTSREFQIKHRGNYAIRYFWRADRSRNNHDSGSKVPLSLSGSVTIIDVTNSAILSSEIPIPEWGNGTDIIAFSHNELKRGQTYQVKIENLDLPEQNSNEAGAIEIDVYYKYYH